MKIINDTILISRIEAIEAKIPIGTINAGRKRNSSTFQFVKVPGQPLHLNYDALNTNHKNLIKSNLLGGLEPVEFLKSDHIKACITSNDKDKRELIEYRISNGNFLTQTDIFLYGRAAAYCYFLSELSIKKIKALGFQDAKSFYNKIIALIKNENLPLPYSYSNLKKKVKKYKLQGVSALISNKYGNANHCKIDKPEQEAFIRFFYKSHQQLRYTQIAFHYNNKAEIEGWPKVTERTIANHIKTVKHQLAGARYGYQEYREINDYVITRFRPTKPNYMWIGDATPWELYYQVFVKDKSGKVIKSYTKRVVVYLVIDAFNDYIVGYAFGDSETNQLAINAWTNACISHNVRPRQVKTDNFGKKELRQFFENVALSAEYFTPSSVGNARDKVIESVFAKIYDTAVRYFPNASGRNIKAKEQPNRDKLEKIKQTFPDLEAVQKQILWCIQEWNNTVINRPDGISRANQHFNADHSEDILLNDLDRLMIFGRTHNYTCSHTNKGISVTLGGNTRKYMELSNEFANTIGLPFEIKYDPYDYSKILVQTNNGRQRFLLNETEPIPMARADFKLGDRTRLNRALTFKERQFQRAIELQNSDDKILREHGMGDLIDDPEAILKTMFSINGQQKPSLYEAENEMKAIVASEPVKSNPKKSSNKKSASENVHNTIYHEALNQKPKVINP